MGPFYPVQLNTRILKVGYQLMGELIGGISIAQPD